MQDFSEFILAASAFLLASAVFRWSNPQKGQSAQSENVVSTSIQLFFHAIHEYAMVNCQGMNDEHYESDDAMSELDHEYPESSSPSSSGILMSNEEDHFTYAGSSVEDDHQSEYDELDHMFELDRERAAVEQESSTSTSTSEDHFSYAGSGVDDASDVNEYDHFDYDQSRVSEKKTDLESPRSMAKDHFSYSALAVEDEVQVSEYDHFAYEKTQTARSRSSSKRRSVGTATDHFSYAGSAVEDEFEPNEYDHYDYEDRPQTQQPSSIGKRPIYSTMQSHFSFSGSCYEPHMSNGFNASPLQPCSVY